MKIYIACAVLLLLTGLEGAVLDGEDVVMKEFDEKYFDDGSLDEGSYHLRGKRVTPQAASSGPSRFVVATAKEIKQELELLKEAALAQTDPLEREFVEKRTKLPLDKPRGNFDAFYNRRREEPSVYDKEEREEISSSNGSVGLATIGLPDRERPFAKMWPRRPSFVAPRLIGRNVLEDEPGIRTE